MFGVLVCRDPSGEPVVLKAFSGQMTNRWDVPGWAGPVATVINSTPLYQDYRALTETYSARLAAVELALRHTQPPPHARPSAQRRHGTRQVAQAATAAGSAQASAAGTAAFLARQRQLLRSRRKALSHELLRRIQASYRPRNFRGEQLSLLSVYDRAQGRAARTAASAPLLPPVAPVGGKGQGDDSGSGGDDDRRDACSAALPDVTSVDSASVSSAGSREDGLSEDDLGLAFPAGTGDCCAPKLLWAATQAGLTPLGLVEFWYGSPPNTATPQGRRASGMSDGDGGLAGAAAATATRAHGQVYGMCDKCELILGSMLCGAEGLRAGLAADR